MAVLWRGSLDKMRVAAAAEVDAPVRYWLSDSGRQKAARHADVELNPHLGSQLTLRFEGQINCVACGRRVSKTFGQGYCFPCSQSRAEADICIVRPDLCHYHDPANPCRDEEFAQTQCFQPHCLYCGLTSGIKIGITRAHHLPARWMDQGAVAAVPLAVLPSRRDVGLLEKRLRDQGFADKTHWTRMLRGNPPEDFDIVGASQRVVDRLRGWGVDGLLAAEARPVHRFVYPVRRWPARVTSHSFDKQAEIRGMLEGIKGQYLMLDTGVINLRKFAGYRVTISVG